MIKDVSYISQLFLGVVGALHDLMLLFSGSENTRFGRTLLGGGVTKSRFAKGKLDIWQSIHVLGPSPQFHPANYSI